MYSISEMGQDIKCQLIVRVKRGKYTLQLDESTDVSGLAQLDLYRVVARKAGNLSSTIYFYKE